MTLDEAKKILRLYVKDTSEIRWNPGDAYCALQGSFSADELEAIAVYMRGTRVELRRMEATNGDLKC